MLQTPRGLRAHLGREVAKRLLHLTVALFCKQQVSQDLNTVARASACARAAAVARAQAKSLPLGPPGFQQAAKRNARQRFSSRHTRARKRVFLSTLLLHWFAKTPPAGLHWNERFYECVAPQIRSAFARLRSPQVCL